MFALEGGRDSGLNSRGVAYMSDAASATTSRRARFRQAPAHPPTGERGAESQ